MEQKQKKQISCTSSSTTYNDRLPSGSEKENYPWFVTQMQQQILYSSLHNPQLVYRCQAPPELIGTQVRACFHGCWVLLSKYPTLFLWNPLTSNLIRLPPLHQQPDQFCLSSPPDHPNSVFLVTTRDYPRLTFCRLDCTTNKLKWGKFSYAKDLRRIIGDVSGFLCHLTSSNGNVYAFGSYNGSTAVIKIDISVQEKKVMMWLSSFVELPLVISSRIRKANIRLHDRRYIKAHCFELFFIHILFEGETEEIVGDVLVYKLDMSNMTWEITDDLKDGMFFLQVDSQYPVYYSPVVTTELAGYIHILDRMGKLLYSYHVKNKTFSIALMSSLVPTSDMSSWGMLEYRLGGADLKQEDDKDDGVVIKPATISKPVTDSKQRTRTDESYLLNMPFHILQSIMEQCGCVEYMYFRATCKLCHLAAPLTLKRWESYSVASPWLMVFDKFQGIITLSDVMMGDKYFIKTPRELVGDIRIQSSRYGWLIMQVGPSPWRLILFNPFTSDIRELPWEYIDGCWFSAPPTSKDCMVVSCNLNYNLYNIYSVAQEQILHRRYLERGDDVPYSFRFPTFHDKDIYALCNDGRLDVIREVHRWVTLDTVVAKPPGCVGSSFLVECEQHLLLVIVGTIEESVDLFKLNDFKKEWEKLDGLGKHTIYIAEHTCFCIEAKTPETENRIYFSGLHNGKIVFYSFKTLSYHTSDGENIKGSLRNFLGTKYQWHPHTWIEPSWS